MEEKKSFVNIRSLNKDLSDFKEEVGNKFERILDILEGVVNKDKKIGQVLPEVNVPRVTASTLVGGQESIDLSPEQQAIFEKYFDTADGFRASFNVKDSLFTITVPIELSNASDAHKSYYNSDLRVKKVDQNNILNSIDTYCALVAQNLRYNRKIKLK